MPCSYSLNEAAGVVKDLVERDRPVIQNGVKNLAKEIMLLFSVGMERFIRFFADAQNDGNTLRM